MTRNSHYYSTKCLRNIPMYWWATYLATVRSKGKVTRDVDIQSGLRRTGTGGVCAKPHTLAPGDAIPEDTSLRPKDMCYIFEHFLNIAIIYRTNILRLFYSSNTKQFA